MRLNVEDVIKILGNVTATAAALAFLVWSARSIILHLLKVDLERHKANLKVDVERDLEAFKAKLKANADHELETLRSALQRVSLEHEVRFRHLHERRAETVAELYRKLASTERAFAQLTAFVEFGTPEEIRKRHEENLSDAQAKGNDLSAYYEQTELFFDDSLCKQMRDLLGAFRQAWTDLQLKNIVDSARERAAHALSAAKTIHERVPGIRAQLTAEFRRLIE
jgi:hypothetical protein